MTMRKSLLTALTLALAGVCLLAIAPATSADMPWGMVVASKAKFPGYEGLECTHHRMRGERTATVCYEGQVALNGFWVKDQRSDGYSAVASWSIPAAEGRPNPESGYCRNKRGNGRWGWCTLFTSERGRIAFAAGVYDGDGKRKWPARFQGWRWEDL